MYYAPCHKGTRVLYLGTSWTWVVSFTFRPLYSHMISRVSHWTNGMIAPCSCLESLEKRNPFLPLPKNDPKVFWSEAQPLHRLLCLTPARGITAF
jgi:hypothetical protein